MRVSVVLPVGRCLVDDHDVGEWFGEERVVLLQQPLQHRRQILHVGRVPLLHGDLVGPRRERDLVRPASVERHPGDETLSLEDDAPAVADLLRQARAHQAASVLGVEAARGGELLLDQRRDEGKRVDLAVRMVEGDAHRLAPVLEDEHVADEVPGAELQVPILPDAGEVLDPFQRHRRQRVLVARRVDDHFADALRGLHRR